MTLHTELVRELFEELCDADAEAVRLRLDGCPPEVVDKVRRLLAADARGGLPEQDELASALAAELAGEMSMRNTSWDPPTSIPGLTLLRELGRGGMGIVFEARQHLPERIIAVKFLGPAYASTVHEAQAMAELHHPSIPVIYEVGEHDGFVYLVMERIEGQPLGEWARGRPEAQRLAVFLQICDAIEHSHQMGVLHRDLKPSNLLAHGDRGWVVDFGLASTGLPKEHDLVGTLPYVAGELLEGEPASPSSDVFALGVVLAEVLGLKRPTRGSRGSTSGQRRLRREAPPWRCVVGAPPVLDSIVVGCLKPTEARYASASSLADDIRAYLTHRPVSTHRGGASYHFRLLAQRRWREALALGLIGVGFFAVVAPKVLEIQRLERMETAAASQLAPVDKELTFVLERGDTVKAQALVDDVLHLPAVRGTQASADLLRRLGVGLLRAGEDKEAANRLAEAFVESADPTSRARVARALIPVLIQRQAWSGLVVLAGFLPEPEAAELRRLSAVATLRSDPDIPILASATRLPVRSNNIVPFEGGVQAIDLDRRTLHIITPRGTTTHAFPVSLNPTERPSGAAHGDVVYWSGVTHDNRSIEVWRSDASGLSLAATIQEQGRPTASAIADPNGDGHPTLYVGVSAPTRSLRGVDLQSGEVFSPAPHFDQARSDIDEMLVLHGDQDEVVVVRGGWLGFDVLTYGGPDRALTVVDRARTGAYVRATLMKRSGSTSLVFRKTNDYPAPTVLGRNTPHGMAEGIYLFERQDTRWLLKDQAPLARVDGTANSPLAGDFDGDGHEDVLFTVSGYGPDARLQRLDEDGFLDAVWIHRIVPLATLDFDGDGDAEVLVRVEDDDQHVWILGTGDEVLPPATAPDLSDYDGEVAGDAAPLLRAGLHREALPLLEALARITPEDDALRQQRWDLVATIARGAGQDRRALQALDNVESEQASVSRVAIRRALHDFDDRGRADTMLPATPSTLLDFQGSLPPVEVVLPSALTSTPAGLAIDMTGSDGVLLRLPVKRVGEHMAVSASLAWESAEIGARFDIVLVDANGDDVLGVGLHPFGGGRSLDRRVRCIGSLARGNAYSLAGILPQHQRAEGIEVRASYYDGTTRCDIDRNDEHRESTWDVDLASTHDVVELQVRGSAEPVYGASRLQATLQSIRVQGVHIAPQNPGPAERWVKGDRSAVDELYKGPHRVPIAAAVGDIDALRDHRDELTPGAWVGTLRRHPHPWFVALSNQQRALAEPYARAWMEAHSLCAPGQLEPLLAHPLVDGFDLDVVGVPELLSGRASGLLESGQAARALAIFDRLIERNGGHPRLHARRVLALESLGRHDAAREACLPLIAEGDDSFLDKVATQPDMQKACEHPGNHRFMDGTQVR